MKKAIRLIFTLLVLGAFVIGISVPIIAGPLSQSDNHKIVRERSDDPWDPGDESGGAAKIKISEQSLFLARRGDDPWDPGDESPKGKAVRNG